MEDKPTGSKTEYSETDSSAVYSRMSRRSVLASGAALTTATVAGCLDDDDDELSIAIISSNSGFGDRAFNDLAVEGLERAQEEYDFELNMIEETDIAQYSDTQAEAAEGNDLVVCVSLQHTEPLQSTAPEFPDTNFMLINDDVDEPNVAGYVWANHEMSYLAGVQAGTVTNYDLQHEGHSTEPDESHIGFVGGEEIPLIEAFERAYVAGAEYVNPDVEVSIGYAGSFGDPAAGEEVAESQYDDGADLIYHAAAATGPGIFEAAQEADRFAIGVDADQSRTLPEYSDVIIGSAIKRIEEGSYDCAVATLEDDFESVSGFNVLGLDEDAVDLIVGEEFEGMMPDELDQNLEDAREGIVDGSIEVPCTHGGC